MKKKSAKKLTLHRETLRLLETDELIEAGGGKNPFWPITLGGDIFGCPSECCPTTVP